VAREVKQLKVWHKAMDLCDHIYRATGDFPPTERFGLTAQMRRAAVSIPSNLAEGYGRGSRKDYRQFVCIARGSAAEMDTQLILAARLGFLAQEDCDRLLAETREVHRMLDGLVGALED
jgi:four helix bundle protein